MQGEIHFLDPHYKAIAVLYYPYGRIKGNTYTHILVTSLHQIIHTSLNFTL